MTTAFDPDLLARYDRPGPRYTSYPSALQFVPGFTEVDFRRHARRSNEEPIPRNLSLYVHVPYCFSPCFYCGCNRIITRDYGRAAPYTERVMRETERVAALFDRSRELVQRGLQVVPQVTCRTLNFEFQFKAPFLFEGMSVFRPVAAADEAGKARLYADPEFRRAFKESFDRPVSWAIWLQSATSSGRASTPHTRAERCRTRSK